MQTECITVRKYFFTFKKMTQITFIYFFLGFKNYSLTNRINLVEEISTYTTVVEGYRIF